MKSEKAFDAVQTMREIRDALSTEIAGMSFEEERRYIERNLKEEPPQHSGSDIKRRG